MISNTQDLTARFNADNQVTVDVSGWENVSFHFIGPSGTINITGSNDSGAVTGVTDGNALLAENFDTLQATNLASGTAVTSVTTADIYKISPIPVKYIRLGGASAAATELIMQLSKPY